MKIIRTISINADVWVKAKKHTTNISGKIQELIENWINYASEEEERNTVDKMRNEMERNKLRNVKLEQEILKLQQEKKDKEKEEIARFGGKIKKVLK